MRIDPVTGRARDLFEALRQAAIPQAEGRRPAALRADDVVVVLGLAEEVGVLARREVDPLDEVQAAKELQRTEDRGSADAQPPAPGLGQQLFSGELALALR